MSVRLCGVGGTLQRGYGVKVCSSVVKSDILSLLVLPVTIDPDSRRDYFSFTCLTFTVHFPKVAVGLKKLNLCSYYIFLNCIPLNPLELNRKALFDT